jgi:hypothetical protein
MNGMAQPVCKKSMLQSLFWVQTLDLAYAEGIKTSHLKFQVDWWNNVQDIHFWKTLRTL